MDIKHETEWNKITLNATYRYQILSLDRQTNELSSMYDIHLKITKYHNQYYEPYAYYI